MATAGIVMTMRVLAGGVMVSTPPTNTTSQNQANRISEAGSRHRWIARPIPMTKNNEPTIVRYGWGELKKLPPAFHPMYARVVLAN